MTRAGPGAGCGYDRPLTPHERPGTRPAALDDIDLTGADGAVWSLPHRGDLDANLVTGRARASPTTAMTRSTSSSSSSQATAP